MDLTSRQWGLLLTFFYLVFFISANYSVPAPIFPNVAEVKGASATEYSIVLGIYDVAALISSFTIPFLIPLVGTTWMLYGGVVLEGVAICVFGTLSWIQDLNTFLLLSGIIRLIEGLGFSAYFIAAYTISAFEFTEKFPIIIGGYEMCTGIGLAAGAVIGGLLYQVAGYLICFLVIGAIVMMPVPILYTLGIRCSKTEESVENKSLLTLFCHYPVVINLFILILSYVFLKFLNPILEPFLRHTFDLDSDICGYVIASVGISYALSSPFWGYVVSKYKTLKVYIVSVGLVIVLIGSAVIGPLMNLQPSVTFTCIGLVLIGAGDAAIAVAGFFILIDESNVAGFGNDEVATACMAGCFMGADAIAGIIGPPVAGMLFDKFGYLDATLYIFFSTSFMVLLNISYIMVLARREKLGLVNMETSPLLQSKSKPTL